MFEKPIKKRIRISGMHCAHCSGRVEAALNSVKGVRASVDLSAGYASVTLKKDIPDSELRAAVEDIGFKVEGIE